MRKAHLVKYDDNYSHKDKHKLGHKVSITQVKIDNRKQNIEMLMSKIRKISVMSDWVKIDPMSVRRADWVKIDPMSVKRADWVKIDPMSVKRADWKLTRALIG